MVNYPSLQRDSRTPLLGLQASSNNGFCWCFGSGESFAYHKRKRIISHSWRRSLLSFLHANLTQNILLILIILDVILVAKIEDIMPKGYELPVPVLDTMSTSILSVFAVEIALYIVAIGPGIFLERLEVLDMLIVSGVLYRDIIHHRTTAGLLILFRFWRVGRIFHGIFEAERTYTELNKHNDVEQGIPNYASPQKTAPVQTLTYFQVLESSPYPCIAARVTPSIHANKSVDEGRHERVIATRNGGREGKDGNEYYQLENGNGWVFRYDFDDSTGKALTSKPILVEVKLENTNNETAPFDAAILFDYDATGEGSDMKVSKYELLTVKEDPTGEESDKGKGKWNSGGWCLAINYEGKRGWVPSAFLRAVKRIN